MSIIKMLLGLADWLMRRLSEAEQRQIGEDRYVKNTVLKLSIRTRVAKEIDIKSSDLDPAAVDDILQRYYRD